jgi:NAD(P)-dependent dehydrogenase (short-subunit alcohol dehydrogenase family)
MAMTAKAKRLGAVVFAVCGLFVLASAPSRSQEPTAASDKPTVLITGANRGLGLEFAKQYAAKGWNVIATARKPDEAFELNKLADERQNLDVVQVDVADIASVDALAKSLAGRPIDLLINNAGFFGDPMKTQLGTIDFTLWDQFYRVNALGPVKVTEALLPNLEAGRMKKVIAVTSRAGAFSYNTDPQLPKMPGHYFYNGAKAALNMMFVTLANDTKARGLTVAVVSPGQVDTQGFGMTGPSIVPIEKSIAGIIAVVDKLTPAESGTFWSWSGERINW